MKTYWLSFVVDGAFAGVAIVEAGNLAGACQVAWEKGCNPGGEVHGVELPSGCAMEPGFRNCLLDRAAALALRDRLSKPAYH